MQRTQPSNEVGSSYVPRVLYLRKTHSSVECLSMITFQFVVDFQVDFEVEFDVEFDFKFRQDSPVCH